MKYVGYIDRTKISSIIKPIRNVVNSLNNSDKISCQPRLYGSASYNLVLRHTDNAYDLDVDIIVQKTSLNYKQLDTYILNHLKSNLKGYKFIRRGKRVIKFEKIVNGRLDHYLEFAILLYDDSNNLVILTKDQNNYSPKQFLNIKKAKYAMSELSSSQRENLREIYKHKKNINANNKKLSYSLLLESLNEV